MAVINRYGLGGAYGDGLYKGIFDDTLNTLRGLAWADTRKCFHLGFNETQGYGWNEDQDGDMIWPENQACVLTTINDSGQQDLIVYDEKSGMPYIMNTREGPSGSGMVTIWKDKVDDFVDASGTAITSYVTLPEHFGEKLGYDIWHEQSRIHARPVQNANRNATGFDANGLPSTIAFASTYYSDGNTVSEGTMSDVALNSEYVHDRKFKGNSLQQKISANVSNYKIVRTESIYKVSDVQKIPAIGANTEAAYELELAAPVIWLTRGEEQLRNRYDNSVLTGTVSATTGPDGLSNSAMTVTSVALANSAIASGTVMLLSTTAYSISGISLTTYDTISVSGTTWYLRYVTGAIGASLSLGAGVVFDLRVYNSVISSAALTHYLDNIENNSGIAYLPVTG